MSTRNHISDGEASVDFGEIGRRGAELLEGGEEWIHRRVESLEIGPDLLVERHLSIDFTVPSRTYEAARGKDGRSVAYLPLSFVRKLPPLFRLDLIDEEGRPLPLLTRVQNAIADEAVLMALASKILGGLPTDAIADHIREIAAGDSDEAKKAFLAIVQPETALQMEANERVARQALARDAAFVYVASHLVPSTLLWVPIRCEPKRRRIIKMDYALLTPNRLNRWRTILAQFGGPQVYWIETPHVGTAASYHLNVSTAPYLMILGTGVETHPSAPVDAPHDVQIERNVAHVYLRPAARLNTLTLTWVSLRVERQGFLTSAFFACASIAAMLGLFWHSSTSMLEPAHLEPTVTILLVVPAVLGALLARPSYVLLRHRLVLGLRGLVAVVGALAVVAAVSAVAWDERTAASIWLACALITGAIAIVEMLAVVFPRRLRPWRGDTV